MQLQAAAGWGGAGQGGAGHEAGKRMMSGRWERMQWSLGRPHTEKQF